MHPDEDEPDLDDLALVPEQRVVVDALGLGLVEMIGRHPWIFEEPERFARIAIEALRAQPITALRIARAVRFVSDPHRERLVNAFLDHADATVFPALLNCHAPYRYDRPGADPSHAFLEPARWRALLERGLASPVTRLDAIRLIFASAVGDDFVDDLAVYSDTDDASVLQVIWFALHAAKGERAREQRRQLETRLDWVPDAMRVR